MSTLFDQVSALRSQGLSCTVIADRLNIGTTAATNYIRKFEASLSDEQRAEIRQKARNPFGLKGRPSGDGSSTLNSKAFYQRRTSELLEENRSLKEQLLSTSSSPPPMVTQDNGTRIGYLAELYFKYRVSRAGLEFFNPEFQAEACDLLVCSPTDKRRFYRCEVKAVAAGKAVRVTKQRYGQTNAQHYAPEHGIDFFVLVDLKTEIVCIMPYEQGVSCTAYVLKPGGSAWSFKDRFDLFI